MNKSTYENYYRKRVIEHIKHNYNLYDLREDFYISELDYNKLLALSVMYNNEGLFDYIIKGFDIDYNISRFYPNSFGKLTPLELCCKFNFLHFFDHLFENVKNINKHKKVIEYLSFYGNYTHIKRVLDRGFNPNTNKDILNSGRYNDVVLTEMLLRYGADIKTKDCNGLMISQFSGLTDTMKVFLENI